MSLKDEERDTLIQLYLAKSDETLEDARLNRSQARWNTTFGFHRTEQPHTN